MRGEALHAGIEVQLLAAVLARVVDEPGDQPLAVAARALARERREIVDVEVAAPGEPLGAAEAGDRDGPAAPRTRSDLVAVLLLAPHARDEVGRDELRAQLVHHREAGGDLGVAGRERDSARAARDRARRAPAPSARRRRAARAPISTVPGARQRTFTLTPSGCERGT